MSLPAPTVHPLGEAAWTVVLGDEVDPGLHRRVLALAARVREANRSGVLELVPSYASLTVHFDPRRIDAAELSSALLRAAAGSAEAAPDPAPAKAPLVIPVRYDGADLGEVAERTGHTPAEVIQLHSEREYRVYLLGFAPGFAYLGDLHPALALPRRESPRPRVPSGAVAIAGRQTAVYPLSTPGGWHLIGTTRLRLFDPSRQPPVLLAPGDRVRFVVAP